MGTQPPFSLLVKPASADCNLRCGYCFYLDRKDLYPETIRHRMSTDILEKLVAGYLATDQPVYAFGWQGGEPTLMGLDFFRQVVALQEKYGVGKTVANGLQTNGFLINDEWASFLQRYRFLVGLSVDGSREIHDCYRKSAGGRGSFQVVMRALACLKNHQVEFNTLTLVTPANAGRPQEVYHFLKQQGVRFHQYIPCVEFDPRGQPMPYTVGGREWGEFLCGLFDLWFPDDLRRVSIRLFDALLARLVNGTINLCHLAADCRQYFVVEHQGDVYPCDFFVDRELKLGNIRQDSWDRLGNKSVYRQFGRQKADWSNRCRKCPYLDLCAGDCLKHRRYSNDAPDRLSWLCEGWQRFFKHALPRLRKIADALKKRQTPGRNDPCPCGSGKKYKRCCGVDSLPGGEKF